MTCGFSCYIFIVSVYLSFILHATHGSGFKVIQPLTQTVNPDGSASISCEHNATVSFVADVRLNTLFENSTKMSTCQMGMDNCKNIAICKEKPNKILFIIVNIGPEAMKMKYECEVTIKHNSIYDFERGTPTVLVAGQVETVTLTTSSVHHHNHHHHPLLPQLSWLLIGLLALVSLYSSVMTYKYIRLRVSGSLSVSPPHMSENNNGDLENCTYVEMRKAPPPLNRAYGIYCG